MYQEVKLKFDLYSDTFIQAATQAANSPKAPAIASIVTGSVWYSDISGAAGAVCGVLSAIGAGIAIWIALERRLYDLRERRMSMKLKKMEIKRLANYMKKKGDT